MQIDQSWTLFLDRDGVLNKRIPDAYINHWDDFRFAQGLPASLKYLRDQFGKIIIVTNQQGIGKGIMTERQLGKIHKKMLTLLADVEVSIDGVYVSPDLKSKKPNTRKPDPAMGFMAKADFPEIDFEKSIMVGDSISDLEFGRNLGMKTVLITSKKDESHLWEAHQDDWDFKFESLAAFSTFMKQKQNG